MYDTFKTTAAAMKAYKRCRTRKDFILKDASQTTLNRLKCKCCGKPIADYGNAPEGYRGNICEWIPAKWSKSGKPVIRAMHYTCAWGAVFEDIAKLEF